MNQDDIYLLETQGWTVECESPLEISLDDDPESRATGVAAELVLEFFRKTLIGG